LVTVNLPKILNYINQQPKTTIMSRIFHLSIIITTLFIIPTVSLAFAAETAGEYIDRKAEIWNLFFRMMTVAFVVGGVIAGTMVWQVWRFRESNPNSKPTEYEEKGEF
jgi:heme/copper-type cytochrome/quinol oxidase subunit 2